MGGGDGAARWASSRSHPSRAFDIAGPVEALTRLSGPAVRSAQPRRRRGGRSKDAQRYRRRMPNNAASSETATPEIFGSIRRGRSRDLLELVPQQVADAAAQDPNGFALALRGLGRWCTPGVEPTQQDRKSTRLNSSHVSISYAVFCLKKKKELEPTSTNTR